MTHYFKFLRDVYFSAGHAPAYINDWFVYDDLDIRGRFRGYDFRIPQDYIFNLVNIGDTQEISFYDLMLLLGLPPVEFDPVAVLNALWADPIKLPQFISMTVAQLLTDPTFLAEAIGPTGPISTVPGPTGAIGPTGPISTVPGPTGPDGTPGISFGALSFNEVKVWDGDKTTSSTEFIPVPGATLQVTTTGVQERLMVYVLAMAYNASYSPNPVPVPISLDIEVDGRRLGTNGGLLTNFAQPSVDAINMSFVAPTHTLEPGTHTLNLMFRSYSGGSVALKAHPSTDLLRMWVVRY